MTWFAALLVLAGVGSAAFAMSARDRRRVANLREVLELTYLDDQPISAAEAGNLLTRSGVLAERMLSGSSLLQRIGGVVERSDWKLSAGELCAVSAAAAGLGLLVGSLAVSVPVGIVLAILGVVTPLALAHRSVKRRMVAFDAQLPEILDLVASSLESGQSVAQAVELVVAEVDEPAASEFAKVLTASRLGVPFVDALQEMAERIGSRDLDWCVQAIVVQQRTGGRLADVLRIVAEVMRSREELRRELRALTAEGRISAYVLTALPVLFAMFLAVARPSYIAPLFTTAFGVVMVVGAVVSMVISYVAMMRIVRIEV
jgi:tight adherence protein B